MIQIVIALLLLVVSQLQAEPIPKDKRLEFIDSLCVQLQRLHPDADSICMEKCAYWRERVVGGASGKEFPYDLNHSIDFHDSWDIYLRDDTGDTSRANWKSTENVCTLLVEDGLGWLYMKAFKDSGLVEQFDRVLEDARDLRGIVLDVRRYYNSSSETLYEILGRFIDQPINGFRYRQRIADTDIYVDRNSTVKPRGPWTFDKPVLIAYEYDWPSCGVPDILMQRSNTDCMRMAAQSGRIMIKDERWPQYVYGIQDSVMLTYGFTAWIPTSQVMHPSLDTPETKGKIIISVDDASAPHSLKDETRRFWRMKLFRNLVKKYEKSEKKKKEKLDDSNLRWTP